MLCWKTASIRPVKGAYILLPSGTTANPSPSTFENIGSFTSEIGIILPEQGAVMEIPSCFYF